MTVILLHIFGGLALLFFGGEGLVRGAVALAKNLHIPTVVIGLTIVALGTSAPELVVSFNAAFENHPDIAVGNIIGSNISNILLVLGVTALIHPIIVDSRLTSFDSLVMGVATLLLIGFAWSNAIGFIHGIILLFCLAVYNFLLYKTTITQRSELPKHQVEEAEEILHIEFSNTKAIVFCLVGLVLLVLGADFLVDGAVGLAAYFGVSEAIIGLTIVAVGSSAPELATCIIAAYHKHSNVAIGNVIGSNIINILGGIGITASLITLPINPQFLAFDLWIMLGITTILMLLMGRFKKIHRLTGGFFILGYIAYITSQFN